VIAIIRECAVEQDRAPERKRRVHDRLVCAEDEILRYRAKGIEHAAAHSELARGKEAIRDRGDARLVRRVEAKAAALARSDQLAESAIGESVVKPMVFALAAELDKAVEIDAYPDRQDLGPDLLAAGPGRRPSDFIRNGRPWAKPVAVQWYSQRLRRYGPAPNANHVEKVVE
jgi:hypothetical protein